MSHLKEGCLAISWCVKSSENTPSGMLYAGIESLTSRTTPEGASHQSSLRTALGLFPRVFRRGCLFTSKVRDIYVVVVVDLSS
jgi:hypothetical protein